MGSTWLPDCFPSIFVIGKLGNICRQGPCLDGARHRDNATRRYGRAVASCPIWLHNHESRGSLSINRIGLKRWGSACFARRLMVVTKPTNFDGTKDSIGGFSVVHSDALRFYADLVQSLGGDPAKLVGAIGVDIGALSGRTALEYADLVNLLRHSAEVLDTPDFGLRLAQLQRGGKVIGPVGIVMKNSATVGQALGYCAKHIHAYSRAARVRFKPNRPAENLLLYLDILLDSALDVRHAVEHALALANFNIMDISQGAAQARELLFRHEPLFPVREYRDVFGCDVRFGQEVDGLVLKESDLQCPVVESDDQILEMATDFIAAKFPPALPPLHSLVRNIVQRHLASGNCTFETIADELCVHPRTLQRRLKDEGTAFETIRDQVRRDIALRLIKQKNMPLTQIAHQIGYAETSVLSRSCQRWFGETPEQLRRS